MLASNFIAPGMVVHLQSENGVLGLGPFPTKDQVVMKAPGSGYYGFSQPKYLDYDWKKACQVEKYSDRSNLRPCSVNDSANLPFYIYSTHPYLLKISCRRLPHPSPRALLLQLLLCVPAPSPPPPPPVAIVVVSPGPSPLLPCALLYS
jgi:hypothetical protein